MKTKLIAKALRSGKKIFAKHGHEILAAGCVISTVGAVATAITGTKKAITKIEEKKQEIHADTLTKKETMKLVWPCYMNTALFTVGSIGCALGALGYSKGKYASLLSFCAARGADIERYKPYYDKYVKEHKDEIKKTIDEKLDPKPKEESKKAQDKPRKVNGPVYFGGRKIKFMEPTMNQPFEMTREELGVKLNKLNAILLNEGGASLNDWYNLLDISPVRIGEEIGWSKQNNPRLNVEIDTYEPVETQGDIYLRLVYNYDPEYGWY